MWIPKSDLIEMGISDATIYRRVKQHDWQARTGTKSLNGGRPGQEILFESLPGELQMKWQRLNQQRSQNSERSSEKRASAAAERPAPTESTGDGRPATEDSASPEDHGATVAGREEQVGMPALPGEAGTDARVQRLAAALARFSPPKYSIEQRLAVERRCVEMSAICDQVIALTTRGKRKGKRKQVTVKSPGASEAGRNRSHSPALIQLAKRAASTDPVYVEMYPSSQNPPSVFTLRKLTKQYRKSGPVVFIRQTQTLSPDRDGRFKPVPPKAEQWLRDYFESYSTGALSRFGKLWLEYCRRERISMPFTDWRPDAPGSCYAWLRTWRARMPQLARALAEEGARSVEAKFTYIIRTYEDVRPRELWTMDWKQLDVCYWKPADKPGSAPRLVREWLCPALDVASRAPFGWQIQDRPNARGVTLAYLDGVSLSAWKQDPALAMLCGVQRTGDPDRKPGLHLDNGKDFRSRTIEGDTIRIKGFDVETGLMLTLKSYDVGLGPDFDLKIRNARIRNAKAKIVEPWFRYAIGLWEEGMPGYCGNRPENKPHWFQAAVRVHNAFCKREDGKPADIRELPRVWREEFERTGTPFLSEETFRARFTARILEYLQSPHGSLRDAIGDVSPIAYLNACADSPHMLTEQSRATLLMVPRPETVINGEIKMTWSGQSFVYRAVLSDLGADGALYNLPARAKVEVRYDPNAIGRVMVLNEGGPVCWAENPQLLGWNARAEDLRSAMNQKKERDKHAREFFATPEPDWRDEAEARQNVVQLKRAVNEGPVQSSGFVVQGSEPAVEAAPRASITTMTRFDGKRGGLRAVERQDEELDDLGIGNEQEALRDEVELPEGAVPDEEDLGAVIDEQYALVKDDPEDDLSDILG